MLPLIQSGVFDVYTSTQQRDIVSDERSRGMEVDRGSAAVLCNSMRWVCVRLCVLASPAALRWDTLSGRIWVLFEPVKIATGLHTRQTLAPSLPRQSVAIFIPADAFHRAHLFLPLHLCKVTKVL